MRPPHPGFGIAEAKARLDQVRRDIAQRRALLRERCRAAENAALDAECVEFLRSLERTIP